MMIKPDKHEDKEQAQIGVWYCESCEGFHIKAANVLLSFTKAEFSEFSNSVFDSYSQAFSIKNIGKSAGNITFDLTSGKFSN